jgi:hypothetical protein
MLKELEAILDMLFAGESDGAGGVFVDTGMRGLGNHQTEIVYFMCWLEMLRVELFLRLDMNQQLRLSLNRFRGNLMALPIGIRHALRGMSVFMIQLGGVKPSPVSAAQLIVDLVDSLPQGSTATNPLEVNGGVPIGQEVDSMLQEFQQSPLRYAPYGSHQSVPSPLFFPPSFVGETFHGGM